MSRAKLWQDPTFAAVRVSLDCDRHQPRHPFIDTDTLATSEKIAAKKADDASKLTPEWASRYPVVGVVRVCVDYWHQSDEEEMRIRAERMREEASK